MKNKMIGIGAVAVLILSSLMVLMSIMIIVPEEAEALPQNPPVASGTLAGDGRPIYDVTANWEIQPGNDVYYEDIIIDVDNNFNIYMMGGDWELRNVTIWFSTTLGSILAPNGIYISGGNTTFYNVSIEHKGRATSADTEMNWCFSMDDEGREKTVLYDPCTERNGSCNFTMFNSTFNLSVGGAMVNEFLVLGGNFTAYNSIIEMPEQFYGSDENITYVNCKVVGNHTFNDTVTTINWVNGHYVTFQDNDTTLWDYSIEDAEGDSMSANNQSLVANTGLSASMMFAPDESCHWFTALNRTETSTGVVNSTNYYPFKLSIDKPTLNTDETKFTLKEYATKEHTYQKYDLDLNQSSGTFNITELYEDAYTTKVVKTSTLTFSTAQADIYINAPTTIDYTIDWVDWTKGNNSYVDTTAYGSYSLDYVTLSANAGNDFVIEKGSTHLFDFTSSIGENTISNYSCVITAANGTVMNTIYGSLSSLRINYTATRAGEYIATLTIEDEEEAVDVDSATVAITTTTATTTTTSSGSTTAAAGEWSLIYPWYHIFYIWESEWWNAIFVDGVWALLTNLTFIAITVACLLLFGFVEFFTHFSFIDIVKGRRKK